MAEFVKDNREKIAMAFYKKTVYNGLLQEQKAVSAKNLTNFQLGEKVFYGRVNMYYAPITVKQKKIKYLPATLSNSDSENPRMGAVDFVVDAFAEMVKQFDKARLTGKISPNEKYLSNLKVYRAYENPNKSYEDYYEVYNRSIASAMQSDHEQQFVNFDQFIDLLMPRISKVIRSHPFTRTGFVKSKFCSIQGSGLALEIADLQYSNDQAKMDQFINNKNWDFFVKTCSAHGFLVDRNIPWRIVADVGNPDFLRFFADRYDISTRKQSLFNKYYELVHERYFIAFKRYLLNLYDRARNFEVKSSTSCDTDQYTPTRSYSDILFDKLYDDEYFLRLYFKIRLMEESNKLSIEEQENLIREMIRYYNNNNKMLNSCLFFFEVMVNKTFDRVGSLSYINAARKAREMEQQNNLLSRKELEDQEYQNSELVATKVDGEHQAGAPTESWGAATAVRDPFRSYRREPPDGGDS
jgi:hypothetical protein